MLNQRFTLIIICLFYALSQMQGQEELPSKVLFVGNSYTYFWNLPQQVEAMAEVSGDHIKTYQSTAGGSHWGHHWRSERDLKTLELIKSGAFDVVIMQNHSMSAFNRKDSLIYFGSKLSDLALQSGAKVYLYETWSRVWDPYMQDVISKTYENLAVKLGANVIPVGQAWERALQLRPNIQLYDPDGSHPDPTGSYLSACVIYGVITGKSPIGLPNRLVSNDFKNEKLYLNIQTPGDALFCQKIADDIIRVNNGKN